MDTVVHELQLPSVSAVVCGRISRVVATRDAACPGRGDGVGRPSLIFSHYYFLANSMSAICPQIMDR